MPKKRNITPIEIEFSAKLASRLRGLRCECGLTQAEIAERANIAPNTYQRYESGESRPGTPLNPEFYTLVDLAKAFDIDLKTLLDI